MRNYYQKKRQEGFTIIEVMIVLAIAGLIMVIVFIAIPQLQRQQRNTARRDVVNRIKSEVDNYSSNNRGEIPDDISLDIVNDRYLNGVDIADPASGTQMSPEWADELSSTPSLGRVYYRTSGSCNGESRVAGMARQYALWTQMEGGSIYCVDNQ